MKIGILTSSRADFGIYSPLLKKMWEDSFFEIEIIAFGTHLVKMYGNTVDEIIQHGFDVKHRLDTIPEGDKPEDIAGAMGKTLKLFSHFWNDNQFDLVFALGDRFEMFAAVAAASPFNIEIAHIHAGEATLGAIDNAYRHSISLMSEYLFTTTEQYRKRAIEIVQAPEKVFNVGALSIDVLKQIDFYTKQDLHEKYGIDFDKPTILSTFHPETVSYEKNKKNVKEIFEAMSLLATNYQIVLTMPNSDTTGLMIRDTILKFAQSKANVFVIESFGINAYLSCMKYCRFLLGNTSSGFVEASFFPKKVINIGDRQKGRIVTPNIKSIEIDAKAIRKSVEEFEKQSIPDNIELYGNGETSDNIVKIVKEIYEQN